MELMVERILDRETYVREARMKQSRDNRLKVKGGPQDEHRHPAIAQARQAVSDRACDLFAGEVLAIPLYNCDEQGDAAHSQENLLLAQSEFLNFSVYRFNQKRPPRLLSMPTQEGSKAPLCPCLRPQNNGIPCVHLLRMARSMGVKPEDLFDFVKHLFHPFWNRQNTERVGSAPPCVALAMHDDLESVYVFNTEKEDNEEEEHYYSQLSQQHAGTSLEGSQLSQQPEPLILDQQEVIGVGKHFAMPLTMGIGWL
uniref:SWIM-type domain-containing protein n=1 Tax=Heterosigma akashiwo TaxID=2829 RepID=A0A7S4D4W4_HETAK